MGASTEYNMNGFSMLRGGNASPLFSRYENESGLIIFSLVNEGGTTALRPFMRRAFLCAKMSRERIDS